MTLKLNGSSSGYTAIDAPAAAGSNTLVLPTTNGSANEVLKTDGSGNLAWVAQAAGGKLIDWRFGAGADGTTAGATSSNKIDLFSQAYTPTDSGSTILIFTWTEIDARTNTYSDQIRIEGVRDSSAEEARWLIHGNFGNNSGSIFILPYIYKPTGWTAGSSSTFKVRLWSEGCSGNAADQYNTRLHENGWYLLMELGA